MQPSRCTGAINPAWPSADSLHNRLSKMASTPWPEQQQQREGAVNGYGNGCCLTLQSESEPCPSCCVCSYSWRGKEHL